MSSPNRPDYGGHRPPTYTPSVSVIRPTGPASAGRAPVRSSATRRSERLYVWIVVPLLLATTALSLFDMYLLVSAMSGY
jgi:hypothetical protein